MAERVGGAFCNHMAAANEATKIIKIKIRRGLKWPQNVEQNATINKKKQHQWMGDEMGRENNGGRRGGTI